MIPADFQKRARRRIGRPVWLAGIILAMVGLAPSAAWADMTIDLTYDSVMDMVRPEVHPGILVHHNLQVVFTGRTVDEKRNRSIKNRMDRNATDQGLGDAEPTDMYVTWRVVSKTRLVRTQRDPQSTRVMTVTLSPGNKCHLEVVDTLNPGFTEYAFVRIAIHTLGYFSTYRVVETSCTIRP